MKIDYSTIMEGSFICHQDKRRCPRRGTPAADQNDSKKMDFWAKSNLINLIAPLCLKREALMQETS